jgi:hypothetical protein
MCCDRRVWRDVDPLRTAFCKSLELSKLLVFRMFSIFFSLITMVLLVQSGFEGPLLGHTAPAHNDRRERVDSNPYAISEKSIQQAAVQMRARSEAKQFELAYKAVFDGKKPAIVTSSDRRLLFADGKVYWLGSTAILVAPATDMAPFERARGSLGVFYLRPERDRFVLLRQFPARIEGSASGNSPTWEISSKFIDNVPVVVSTRRSVAKNGTICAFTAVAGLSSEAPGEYISFLSEYDDAPSNPIRAATQSIEGEIANIEKNRDFDVRYRGSLNDTHRYNLYFDSYARSPDDKAEELPLC